MIIKNIKNNSFDGMLAAAFACKVLNTYFFGMEYSHGSFVQYPIQENSVVFIEESGYTHVYTLRS